jgi:TonB-dependent Receptor Plug Domain
MKNLILFAGFCLFLVGFNTKLNAQKPCYLLAHVFDNKTGEPLEGALLKLDGIEMQVATDSLGMLRMPFSCDKHAVGFHLLGYKNYLARVFATGEMQLEVQMENIGTQIEEVVVSSQSTVRTMETPALGVNLLSMKAVEKIVPTAGEVDILKSLQTLPGISAVGEGANGINIRGGSVDQNLILIDNMPVFNPTHMLGLFSVFPTDAIRELQIYKGSIPARYGGRTAGVLDVKMSEPSMEKYSMRGGIGLISNRLHIETPLIKNKLALMSSVRFSYNEYLLKFYNNVLVGPVFSTTLPNSKPKFFDFANKLVWKPTVKDNISLANYLSNDSYKVFNIFNVANIIPDAAVLKYGQNSFALRWNHSFNDRFNLNTLLVSSQYKTKTDASLFDNNFKFSTGINYYSLKTEATYAPSEKQRINFGVVGTNYNLRPADLDPAENAAIAPVHLPKEKAVEVALFVSDEYELSRNLLGEIGLRYVNYWNLGALDVPIFSPDAPKSPSSITGYINIPKNGVESHYGVLEPRLALRYKINDQSSLKVGYNRMNQFLQMISNNSTPLPDVRWKTSNRYVRPAQSDLLSVGYFREQGNRMWEWSLEGYYRRQRHIFDYLNGAELSINPIVETQLLKGNARAYGAEFLVNKKKGVMTGWMTYTYARSFTKIDGDFPALQQLNSGDWFRTNIDKPHTLNVIASFQNDQHNSLAFTFVYSTGRPYTSPVSFYYDGLNFLPVFTERNNARIADYHRLDVAWTITNPSMKKRKGEGSWVISVYNLYGRKNAFSYFFDNKLSTFQPFKVSVFPSPIFSITFNFKFGKK